MEKENKRIPNLLVLPMSPEDWGFSILVVGLQAYVSASVSTAGAATFGIA